MTNIIYILSSNIEHHNKTILHFFNDCLSNTVNNNKRVFFVVNKNKNFLLKYQNLHIKYFQNQITLSVAIIKLMKSNNNLKFFFHGQFNVFIWIALFIKIINKKQFLWHIWGGDLYETSKLLKFKLLYYLRRLIYKNIECIFGTQGDLIYFSKFNINTIKYILYFPVPIHVINNLSDKLIKNKVTTILLGNSGDPSNRHIEGLQAIKKQFINQSIKIIIPAGYPKNNHAYIIKIIQTAKLYFLDHEIIIIKQIIKYHDYCNLLKQCDLAYLIFQRQQGIGTISLLIKFSIPFVIDKKNYFYYDLIQYKIPFIFLDTTFNNKILMQIKKQLIQTKKNTIYFLNYKLIIKQWQNTLKLIEHQ
uniref:TDP-N-acetylfucosamine:lipid II N-acetylfucosaminyltransferase n=1 Tax=Candidatus Aschnera chinzeii TaxID=1485666 RepID=A0AAT9G4R3_9ENTR|nr:MAG: TDP-N-acetylfucosamine:lipid II N-acetylfucosaminyltransferase [Candidatus Aschnera chinzeii]